jgi:ABC-type amino acid transport substrate-binding protein
MKNRRTRAHRRSSSLKSRRAKTSALVGLIAGCITVAGCSSGTASSVSTGTSSTGNSLEVQSLHQELPASIRSSGTVSDYINIPYAPMEMFNSSNQPIGVDISLMNDMAQVLGIKVKYTNVQFPELFTAVQSGRADMVMSGISDRSSTHNTYTFIDYFGTGSQMETELPPTARPPCLS